jgi:hypothetical protein
MVQGGCSTTLSTPGQTVSIASAVMSRSNHVFAVFKTSSGKLVIRRRWQTSQSNRGVPLNGASHNAIPVSSSCSVLDDQNIKVP